MEKEGVEVDADATKMGDRKAETGKQTPNASPYSHQNGR